MREPRRLREERGSDLERALLNAGVSYRGSAATRAKALAALGLAGSTAVLVGGVSAATATATVSSAAKLAFAKVVVAVSLAGVVAAVPVGAYVWHRLEASASASALFGAGASAMGAARVEVVSDAELAAPLKPITSRIESTVVRSPKPEAKSSGTSANLTRELATLDAARATLASGQAARALSILDRYGREFPNGRLEIEAEVLRIDALTNSGRGALAKKRAEAFVRRYPGSVFAQRVRGYLDN